MPAAIASSKQKLRKQMRQKRRALLAGLRHQASVDLARNINRLSVLSRARTVALYQAADGEVDPGLAMRLLRLRKKNCYLPILHPHQKGKLLFAPDDGLNYRQNRYDILEPKCPRTQWRFARQMDLIFLPLVAFDSRGNRLGMGGGYYDRTLHWLARRESVKRPKLVGLAYHFQQVDNIESEPWDIRLDGLVTERDIVYFKPS